MCAAYFTRLRPLTNWGFRQSLGLPELVLPWGVAVPRCRQVAALWVRGLGRAGLARAGREGVLGGRGQSLDHVESRCRAWPSPDFLLTLA